MRSLEHQLEPTWSSLYAFPLQWEGTTTTRNCSVLTVQWAAWILSICNLLLGGQLKSTRKITFKNCVWCSTINSSVNEFSIVIWKKTKQKSQIKQEGPKSEDMPPMPLWAQYFGSWVWPLLLKPSHSSPHLQEKVWVQSQAHHDGKRALTPTNSLWLPYTCSGMHTPTHRNTFTHVNE